MYLNQKDIWKLKINYKSGVTYEEQRLTFLGSLSYIETNNWVDNRFVFSTGSASSTYELNTIDGTILKSSFLESSARIGYTHIPLFPFSPHFENFPINLVSPDGSKYLILGKNQGNYIYDLTTSSYTKLNGAAVSLENNHSDYYGNLKYTCFWLDNFNAILYIPTIGKLYRLNISNAWVSEFMNVPEFTDREKFISDSNNSGLSRIFSSNKSFFVIQKKESRGTNHNSIPGTSGLYVFKNQDLTHDVVNINGNPFRDAEKPDYDRSCNYKWISDEKLIYINRGDLINQGTWLYNAKTKVNKKISPFILEQILLLPKAKKVLFISNKQLFCMDIEGENLVQVTNTPVTTSGGLTALNWYFHPDKNQIDPNGLTKIQGEVFLASNAKKATVKVLASGLQYEILKPGNGTKPTLTSQVTLNFKGSLLDETVFFDTYKTGKPSAFRTDQAIKGLTEALLLMPQGSKWKLYIPYQLGYEGISQPEIPPYSTLVFEVELIEVK